MMRPFWLVLLALGCGEAPEEHGHSHGPGDDAHAHGPADDTAVVITDRGEAFELFMELDGPVAGATSGYAAHVTRIDGHAAATTGALQLRFEQDGFAVEAHTDPGVARPGVFIGDVKLPGKPGDYTLVARYTDGDTAAEWRRDGVRVGQGHAVAQAPAAEGEIAFLMESQWQIPFGVGVVERRTMAPTLTVAATVQPAPDATAVVAAPADGLVAWTGDLPIVGRRVTRGEVLATWLPVGAAEHYGTLQSQLAAARLEVGLAEKDQARVASLAERDLVPARRVEESDAAVGRARAEVAAAERRLAALTTSGSGAVPIRAPAAGLIVHVGAGHGEAVGAGDPLVTVASGTGVLLQGHVHERSLGSLASVSSLSVLRGDWEAPRDLTDAGGRLLTEQWVFDEHTLSAPLAVRVDGDIGLGPGDLVELQVGLGDAVLRRVVPRTAIVEINGQDVVFVRRSGESFTRRRVVLGQSDASYVEVLDGVEEGEHVVVRGGYDVHVASLSGSLESHTH